MQFSSYEKQARREIDRWLRGDGSLLAQAVNLVMKPVDWVVEQAVPASITERAGEGVEQFLEKLNDASRWIPDTGDVTIAAQAAGLEIARVEDLRQQPLEDLDGLARRCFSENMILAALGGGGTGLGGAVFIAADIPLLFMINFRLIQQIGASYGFPMTSPEYSPVVLSIFNAAVANRRDARSMAVREVSVAAAALAGNTAYRGRVRGTLPDQSRHLPRELAKNLVGRKLLQTIPLAGAAVGAGINYWFTSETAWTTYMLFRSLYLEHKDRR